MWRQPGLHREFQDRQSYLVRLLKKKYIYIVVVKSLGFLLSVCLGEWGVLVCFVGAVVHGQRLILTPSLF